MDYMAWQVLSRGNGVPVGNILIDLEVASAGDAGLPDLIYDSLTDKVFLDAADIGGTLQASNLALVFRFGSSLTCLKRRKHSG